MKPLRMMLCVLMIVSGVVTDAHAFGGKKKQEPKTGEIWVASDHQSFYTEAVRGLGLRNERLEVENGRSIFKTDSRCIPNDTSGYNYCFYDTNKNTYKFRFSKLGYDNGEGYYFIDLKRSVVPKEYLAGIPIKPFSGNEIHTSPFIRVPLSEGKLNTKSLAWTKYLVKQDRKTRSIRAYIIIDTTQLPLDELIPVNESGQRLDQAFSPW